MSDRGCNLYHWEHNCEPGVYIHVPDWVMFITFKITCSKLTFAESLRGLSEDEEYKNSLFSAIWAKSRSQKNCLPFLGNFFFFQIRARRFDLLKLLG